MSVALAAILVVAGLPFHQRATHGKHVVERVMTAPPGTELPAPGKAIPAVIEPAPYTYDPRTNRHWDPDHHHWHRGRPPAREAVADSMRPGARVATSAAAALR